MNLLHEKSKLTSGILDGKGCNFGKKLMNLKNLTSYSDSPSMNWRASKF